MARPSTLVDQTLTRVRYGPSARCWSWNMVGLDVGWRIRRSATRHLDDVARAQALPRRTVSRGQGPPTGRKTGARAGISTTKRKTRPVPTRQSNPCCASGARRRGNRSGARSRPRRLSNAASMRSSMKAHVFFDDGIVPRLSDVDTIFVHGFGFPARRGGPPVVRRFRSASTKVYAARSSSFHLRFGDTWAAGAVARNALAREGSSFYAHAAKATSKGEQLAWLPSPSYATARLRFLTRRLRPAVPRLASGNPTGWASFLADRSHCVSPVSSPGRASARSITAAEVARAFWARRVRACPKPELFAEFCRVRWATQIMHLGLPPSARA